METMHPPQPLQHRSPKETSLNLIVWQSCILQPFQCHISKKSYLISKTLNVFSSNLFAMNPKRDLLHRKTLWQSWVSKRVLSPLKPLKFLCHLHKRIISNLNLKTPKDVSSKRILPMAVVNPHFPKSPCFPYLLLKSCISSQRLHCSSNSNSSCESIFPYLIHFLISFSMSCTSFPPYGNWVYMAAVYIL